MSRKLDVKIYTFIAVISLFGPSITAVSATGLYKWVDENGEVRYSDHLPPQQSKKRFQTLAPDGRILETQKAAKTPEQKRKERAEQQRLEREARRKAREEARIQAEQEHHDTVLMMTFSTEAEIVEAQNERVEVIDSVIRLLKKNISQEEEKLKNLEQRAEIQYINKDKPVPGGLAQNIEYFTEKILSRQQQIQLKMEERDRVKAQYAADLIRYRELSQQQKEREEEARRKAEESNL